ncbi:MAG: hypothetical protein HOD37_19570 [Bacteroidetes bacterium]|nr:hypothetical protein [Bacteroidota bacterium]
MKRTILWLALLAIMQGLYGQSSNLRRFNYVEFFGGLGSSHSFKDFGENDPKWSGKLADIKLFQELKPLETRVSSSIGARYLFNRTFAISGQLAPVWLSREQLVPGNPEQVVFSDVYLAELSAQAEIYWLGRYSGINPYFFGGFGAVAWYSHTQDAILQSFIHPGNVLLAGLGFRYSHNRKWTHTAELGFRYGLNDYLEQFPDIELNHDNYYLFQYKLCYQVSGGKMYTKKGMLRQGSKNRANRRNKGTEGVRKGNLIDPASGDLSKRDRRKVQRHLNKIERLKRSRSKRS